jgi:hypothetical protein
MVALLIALAPFGQTAAAQSAADWAIEFPRTDFSQATVALDEIQFDRARRDTIPPIDDPRFVPQADLAGLGALEPVISVVIGDAARAYPLRIMLWHEIVNDRIGGVPIFVTDCPLCNSGVVFDRRVDGRELDFGNAGRIRRFDMVLYDRQSESWWQQFSGTAIVGDLAGSKCNWCRHALSLCNSSD